MGTALKENPSALPPLPHGFTLDVEQDSAIPPLPAGFTLDADPSPTISNVLEAKLPIASQVVPAAARGAAHGTVGLAESVNIGGQFLAGRAGAKGAQDFFKAGSKFWEGLGNGYAPPPELQGNILDKPELLGNASWWAYNVADMTPALAASMVPGAAAGKYIKIGGQIVKLTPQVVARLARTGAAVTAGGAGGSLEGVQTYKTVLERGGQEGEAAAAGTVMGLAAAGLNALSFGKMQSEAKNRLLKFVLDGTTEGVTELLEEPAEGAILSATDVSWPEDAPGKRLREGVNVLPVAALTGGAGGALLSGGPGGPAARPEFQAALEKKRAELEAQKPVRADLPAEIPPLPPGFVVDEAVAPAQDVPALPPGYVLDPVEPTETPVSEAPAAES